MFNFFSAGGVSRPLLFLNCVTYKIIVDTVYRLLIKSNCYTVHKKRFKFFLRQQGVNKPLLFFELCNLQKLSCTQ
jgi:hypothetical protein